MENFKFELSFGDLGEMGELTVSERGMIYEF